MQPDHVEVDPSRNIYRVLDRNRVPDSSLTLRFKGAVLLHQVQSRIAVAFSLVPRFGVVGCMNGIQNLKVNRFFYRVQRRISSHNSSDPSPMSSTPSCHHFIVGVRLNIGWNSAGLFAFTVTATVATIALSMCISIHTRRLFPSSSIAPRIQRDSESGERDCDVE